MSTSKAGAVKKVAAKKGKEKPEAVRYINEPIKLPKATKGVEINFCPGCSKEEFLRPILEEHGKKIFKEILEKSLDLNGGKVKPKISVNTLSSKVITITSMDDLKKGLPTEECIEYIATTTVHPDAKKDDHFAFTTVTKVYPFDFMKKKLHNAVTRFNAIAKNTSKINIETNDIKMVQLRDDIIELLDEKNSFSEVRMAIIDQQLQDLELYQ